MFFRFFLVYLGSHKQTIIQSVFSGISYLPSHKNVLSEGERKVFLRVHQKGSPFLRANGEDRRCLVGLMFLGLFWF